MELSLAYGKAQAIIWLKTQRSQVINTMTALIDNPNATHSRIKELENKAQALKEAIDGIEASHVGVLPEL